MTSPAHPATQHGRLVGWVESRADGRVILPDVEPGAYDVLVSGRKIAPFSLEIAVDAGRRSTVTVSIGSSAPVRLSNAVTQVGEFLLEILKGIGIVALVALWLYIELELAGC